MLHKGLPVQAQLGFGPGPEVESRMTVTDLRNRFEQYGHVHHRHSSVAIRSKYIAFKNDTGDLPLLLLYLQWRA